LDEPNRKLNSGFELSVEHSITSSSLENPNDPYMTLNWPAKLASIYKDEQPKSNAKKQRLLLFRNYPETKISQDKLRSKA